jgi:hypothetical protein
MQRLDPTPRIALPGILALLLCSPFASVKLVAQSGILMNNGLSIGTSGGQVSIFADSGSHRAKIINYDFDTAADVIGTWPCTTAGGIVYGISGLYSVAKEACWPGNTSGYGVLTENSSGVPAWTGVTAPLTLSSSTIALGSIASITGTDTALPSSSGLFTNGNVTEGDGNGGVQDSGVALSSLVVGSKSVLSSTVSSRTL